MTRVQGEVACCAVEALERGERLDEGMKSEVLQCSPTCALNHIPSGAWMLEMILRDSLESVRTL